MTAHLKYPRTRNELGDALEDEASMSLMATLRRGLKFFLMSFGISSPEKKPAGPSAQKPGSSR